MPRDSDKFESPALRKGVSGEIPEDAQTVSDVPIQGLNLNLWQKLVAILKNPHLFQSICEPTRFKLKIALYGFVDKTDITVAASFSPQQFGLPQDASPQKITEAVKRYYGRKDLAPTVEEILLYALKNPSVFFRNPFTIIDEIRMRHYENLYEAAMNGYREEQLARVLNTDKK